MQQSGKDCPVDNQRTRQRASASGTAFAIRTGVRIDHIAEERTMKRPVDVSPGAEEKGAIGYILLWAMGVPASLLFLIFLVRGCT
jgi:hypothetical protein